MKKIMAFCLFVMLFTVAARAHTRDEVRAAYAAVRLTDETPYAQTPSVTAPYASGALTEDALTSALDELNFIRYLAGLAPVVNSDLYTDRAQRAAVLLAALDYVDHDAPRPSNMEDNFYVSAHLGTESSNIARLNWMRPSILKDGVDYFARDDGDANLDALGHRRWVLNPMMGATGFGLANSAEGMSYVVMYAHDFSVQADWEQVCWPGAGAFPAELMHADLAWSVSLNPDVYGNDLRDVTITLTETVSGMTFTFRPRGASDGFCTINTENYGSGPCIIFRPDFTGTDFTDYRQNQIWTVTLTGNVELTYTVEMISLYPQEAVNVEMDVTELALNVGDTETLTACVVPDYADDLSVMWSSSDVRIATVDVFGNVTAHESGNCEITAAIANGREDVCKVVVFD